MRTHYFLATIALQELAAQHTERERVVRKPIVRETLGPHLAVGYERVPELIAGLELSSGGRKVSWSTSGYLSSLEQHLSRVVEQTPIAHEQS